MRFATCLLLLLFCCRFAAAQTAVIDSLRKALPAAKEDSNRVTLLWKLAEQYRFFKPDTTVQLAQRALLLAQRIGYVEGESRSLAVMATGQYLMGNYPQALSNYMGKLQLEEKRASGRNYASALNNIGLMYILLNDYPHALEYLRRADSTLTATGGAARRELENPVLINMGEAFYRLQAVDSATHYFTRALALARAGSDGFSQGASLLGLGNVAAMVDSNEAALRHYKAAFPLLNDGVNNDLMCEVSLGLANVFSKTGPPDSALHYANLAYRTGERDGFLSRQLDAAIFLSKWYKGAAQFDSAFAYLERANALQNELKGQERIRETTIISSNEKLRQAELAEQRRLEKADRLRSLQIRIICIFIPVFFLLTVGISRVSVHPRVIRFMGVVSLLLVFEFLTLLLHPLVANVTHHNKILELLAFVGVGAALVPLHHRLEHWLIEMLFHQRTKPAKPLPVVEAEEPGMTQAPAETEAAVVAPPAVVTADAEQKKSASAEAGLVPSVEADDPKNPDAA